MIPIGKDCGNELERQQSRLVRSWISSIAAIALFLTVTHLGEFQERQLLNPSLQPKIRIALWIVSLSVVWVLQFWRKGFLTHEFLFREAKKTRSLKIRSQQLTPTEEELLKVVSVYRTNTRITFAFAQSIAIFGLILGAMGPYLWDQYLLSVFAVLLHLYLYPSRNSLQDLVKEFGGG